MKKGINLLQKKHLYTKRERTFRTLRSISFVTGAVTVLSFVILSVMSQDTNTKYKGLLVQKERYLQASLARVDIEKKVAYVNKKGSVLAEYLGEDVQFADYYLYLESFVQRISPEASLQLVTLDTSQETQVVVTFAAYEDLISFVTQVEADDFLSRFASIEIVTLKVGRDPQEVYQVTIEGRFAISNEKKTN